jgi:allophanate hydrolase
VAERHAAMRALFDEQPEAIDATVHKIVARAAAFSATDAFVAQYRLRALHGEMQKLWHRVDVLMVPTAPGHPTFDEVDADPIGVNALLGTYTNFVNLLGWCALALPTGFTAAGLPFGTTFIAPGGFDAALAHFGRKWQRGQRAPREVADADATDTSDAPRAPALATPLQTPRTEPTLAVAAVGAHLTGLPLNAQLIERGGRLLEATTTAPHYRLYALPGSTPPKPGMVRVAEGGAAIALEVWALPQREIGSFLALIPAPLGLGSVELADGRRVHGFLCESHAVAGARDITAFGGWRAYLASL